MPRLFQHHFPLEIFRLSWVRVQYSWGSAASEFPRLVGLQIGQQIPLFGLGDLLLAK